MSNTLVNERSQRRPTIEVLNSDDEHVSPSTVRYRVDCVTTQTQVIDWTDAGAVSTQTIAIPASAMVIIDNANAMETKRMSVQVNWGTDSQLSQAIEWDVLNNEFYT